MTSRIEFDTSECEQQAWSRVAFDEQIFFRNVYHWNILLTHDKREEKCV